MIKLVQNIEDSSSEIRLHECEVFHDAFDLELSCDKEESYQSEEA